LHAPTSCGPRPSGRQPRDEVLVDTADVDELREASSWGLVDGVKANPGTMSKPGPAYAGLQCEIIEAPNQRRSRRDRGIGDAGGERKTRASIRIAS